MFPPPPSSAAVVAFCMKFLADYDPARLAKFSSSNSYGSGDSDDDGGSSSSDAQKVNCTATVAAANATANATAAGAGCNSSMPDAAAAGDAKEFVSFGLDPEKNGGLGLHRLVSAPPVSQLMT